MCSIVGAAGPIEQLSPKLKQEFHEFLSCLFTMAELRGRDAAGYWVWRGNHYVFEKRPIPAEDLIQRSAQWKSLRYNPGSLYLLHTRAATDGDPNDNINNHPHMGEHSVMIHNGMIWSHDTIAHVESLSMKSECDSEVLLRLAEARDDIVEGLQYMYETTHQASGNASIAVAFVDRRDPTQILLSRNSGNPCYVYRSERFNCTFFASTDTIFERALEMLYGVKTPHTIEAKAENVSTYDLYRLDGATGTYEKEELVRLSHGVYGGSGYYSQADDWEEDWDDDEEETHYTEVLFNNRAMSVSLDGDMNLIAEKLQLEDDEEETKAFGEEPIPMPDEVEQDLMRYLNQKLQRLPTL